MTMRVMRKNVEDNSDDREDDEAKTDEGESDDRDSEVILRKMMFRTLVLIFLNFMMFMKFEMRF